MIFPGCYDFLFIVIVTLLVGMEMMSTLMAKWDANKFTQKYITKALTTIHPCKKRMTSLQIAFVYSLQTEYHEKRSNKFAIILNKKLVAISR